MATPRGAAVTAAGWYWRHADRSTPAVSGLNLEIKPGERVLLVGPSGAGKSTLLHALAGVLTHEVADYDPDDEDQGTEFAEQAGTLAIDGAPVAQAAHRAPGTPTVGLMQQDPETQVVQATVGDDVAFGAENLAVPPADIPARVSEALDAVGLDVPLERPTSALSGGQKQRLALAGILAMRPSLLLLDEPTANLDPEGVKEVRDAVVRVLERTGATAIIVEHRLAAWAPHVDRVVALEPGGGVAASGTPAELFGPGPAREALIRAGVWVPDYVPELGSAPECSTTAEAGRAAESIASARDLDVGRGDRRRGAVPALTGINLELEQSSALCVTGPNGAGKSTLALTLGGLLPELGGQYALADGRRPYKLRASDLVARIGSVFQEPEHQFVTESVRAELEYGQRHARDAHGARLFSPEEVSERTERLLERLRLSDLADANPFTLSGGEKRRLSVAAVLATRPSLLILDEPTFGQDANTWRELAELLREERAAGIAIVAVTHDEHFARAIGAEQADVRELAGAPRMSTPVGAAGTGAPPSPGTVSPGMAPEPQAAPAQQPASQPPSPQPPPSPLSLTPTARAAASWLGRANPLSKLAALFCVTAPLVVTMDVVSASVVVLATLVMLPLSGVRVGDFMRRAWVLLVAGLFSAWGTALVGEKTGELLWQAGWFSMSTGSVESGVATGLRIFAVALPAVLMIASTDPTDLANALAQKAKVPHRFVLGALAAMRLVGLLAEEWQVLSMARRARGVGSHGGPWRRAKANAGQAFGLIVQAIRRASRLAVSMEAKGFGRGARTWARESVFTRRDVVVVLGGVVLGTATVAAAVLAGTWNVVWTG